MKYRIGIVVGIVGAIMVVVGFLNVFGLTTLGPGQGLLVGGAGLCILAMFLTWGGKPAGT